MSPYKPLYVDLSFDYVSFPFPETLTTALIPHRVTLQTDHQRRTFCCRKGNVVISGLTFGAWSTSLLDSLSLLTLSRWAAATRSEQTSSRFCPSWSSTSPTSATATCTIAVQATMRLVVSGIRTLLPRPSLGRTCQSCCKRYRRSCDSWACECSHCRFMRGSSASFFLFTVCMFFCREQDELTRQLEDSVSDQERKELQREQERLLLKMERKGEQIHKLHKHRKQVGPHTKFIHNHAKAQFNSESLFFFSLCVP